MTEPERPDPEAGEITMRIGAHIVRRFANGSASITEQHGDGFASTVEFTADEVGVVCSAIRPPKVPDDDQTWINAVGPLTSQDRVDEFRRRVNLVLERRDVAMQARSGGEQ